MGFILALVAMSFRVQRDRFRAVLPDTNYRGQGRMPVNPEIREFSAKVRFDIAASGVGFRRVPESGGWLKRPVVPVVL